MVCRSPLFPFLFLFLFLSSSYAQNFAAIGDYGSDNENEKAVAELVKSWNSDFIITLGDNNYFTGDSATIDKNIGKYYHEFIYPYKGDFGEGATYNRFFPALGNHDLVTDNAQPYFDYFTLPGNERYYDFVKGNIHFFVLDSDPAERDGTSASSKQARWLKNKLNLSKSLYNIVYFHHPPFTSGAVHRGAEYMRWPFREWGASIVLAGHEHVYERLYIDSLYYVVNGIGGTSLYEFGAIETGSIFRYNAEYGAMKVSATSDSMSFYLYSINNHLKDSFSIKPLPGRVPFMENVCAYPSPCKDRVFLSYEVRKAGPVTIRIFDTYGREVGMPVNENAEPGTYEVVWEPGTMRNDIYYYLFSSEETVKKGKIIVLK